MNQKYRVRSVHVVGPDEQDLVASLAKICREATLGNLAKGGHRWVLNKDSFLASDTTPRWSTQALLPSARIPQDDAIGHVEIGKGLLYGIHGRSNQLRNGKPRSSLELIQDSLNAGELRISTKDRAEGSTPKNEWLEFLGGST